MKTFLQYLAEAEKQDLSPEAHSKPENPGAKMVPGQDEAHPGKVFKARDVGGYDRIYHMNRLMMAMAKADGKSTKPVDSDSETWFEKYNTIHPYSKEEGNMVQSAMKTVPTDGNMVGHDTKSRETDDVHRVSPHRNPGAITRRK